VRKEGKGQRRRRLFGGSKGKAAVLGGEGVIELPLMIEFYEEGRGFGEGGKFLA